MPWRSDFIQLDPMYEIRLPSRFIASKLLPGSLGQTAKRLAANIGDGAMS